MNTNSKKQFDINFEPTLYFNCIHLYSLFFKQVFRFTEKRLLEQNELSYLAWSRPAY